ncbi:MAG: NPXTG-anchored protein [Oscillospiraceae bacterium]|nr:NPXTG-anchored protein [Oscillospiraceae bacterium]
MKVKSILASLGACAIALSAMAISASAAITNENGDGNYKVDFADDANKLSAYGLKATITMADGWESSGAGGGIIANADGVGWKQYEWGITGEGTDAKNVSGVTISGADGKFTITMDNGAALFADTDTYTEGFVSAWWGADFTVDSLVLLDQNGNEFGAGSDNTDNNGGDNTTAPANNTTAPAANNTTAAAGAKTGDAGVSVAVGALALAGAAAVVTRKKH